MSYSIGLRCSLFLLAVVGPAASALAGSARIVERPDVPPFVTIQGAVDGALDGETVVVGQGTYAGFTVAGKSITVVGEGNGLVVVNGTVTVKDLASTGTVLLSGLTITGNSVYGYDATPGMILTSNAGHVRVHACSITGGFISGYEPDAADGVQIVDCPRVAFVACTVAGGNHQPYCTGCMGNAGGNGITATNGGVALYDCTVKGGRGSSETVPGGNGGHGYVADSWGLVASGSTFTGGYGGYPDYIACFSAGSGGDGIRLISAQAHLLDIQAWGGQAGKFHCQGPPPNPGQPINNQSSVVDMLTGTRRKLTAPGIASDAAPLGATVTGEAGDKVYVLVARTPFFQFVKAFNGTWLVPIAQFLTYSPSIVLPGTAPTNMTIPLPSLQPNVVNLELYMQLLVVDITGKRYLSSPHHLVLLNHDALPDCNGNGVLDFVDTIAGLGNVPDNDNDFIPDTCGGPPTTHFVDAAAAPGGNGSFALPFQNIRNAIDVSTAGHTVIVRDGLYTGALNKDLDFQGRNITVQSENGPANCVIDCQGSGRAFVVRSPATIAARIQGFTIRNGGLGGTENGAAIYANEVTVLDCTFEDCVITPLGTYGMGGAIFATRIDMRRCTFRGSQSGPPGSYARGGAVYVVAIGGPSIIQRCVFEDNRAAYGGALYLEGGQSVSVSHCDFRANRGWRDGGAIWSRLQNTTMTHRIDDCLFAGNIAGGDGGALSANSLGVGAFPITDSTFTANVSSGGYGGAMSFRFGVAPAISNCILWRDTAGVGGAEISLRDSGPGAPAVTVSWSDVQGGQAAVHQAAGTLTWGAGNIDLDPAFNDPDGPDNDPLTFFDNDYTLALASPCIDAADNASIPADLTDIDGDGNTTEQVPLDLLLATRRIDVVTVPDTGNGAPPIVDMGAYERP